MKALAKGVPGLLREGSLIAIVGPVAHPEPWVTKVVTSDPVSVSIIV